MEIEKIEKLNPKLSAVMLIVGKNVIELMDDWELKENDTLVMDKLKELKIETGYLVTVDIHN